MLNASGELVTARGKIDSCMDCHAKYDKTDFVTRRYPIRNASVTRPVGNR